jgi:hypothetical protein
MVEIEMGSLKTDDGTGLVPVGHVVMYGNH